MENEASSVVNARTTIGIVLDMTIFPRNVVDPFDGTNRLMKSVCERVPDIAWTVIV